MKSAMVDTNVSAAWLAGDERVRDRVLKALSELGENPALFVSVVTIQEMMVWAHLMADAEGTRSFLSSNFATLDFTEDCALRAAALAAAVGRPRRSKPKSKDRAQVELWQRDAAIAGTAVARKVDVLLTRDADFGRFREHVDFRIVIVG